MVNNSPNSTSLLSFVSFIFGSFWNWAILPNWVVSYFPKFGKHLSFVSSARQAARDFGHLPFGAQRRLSANWAPSWDPRQAPIRRQSLLAAEQRKFQSSPSSP